MVIFEQEKQDGLAEVLLDPAKSCITFAALAEPDNLNDVKISLSKLKEFTNLAKAQITDKDLYGLKTILVTTSWNKNDDVFCKEEVWAARHSPEDKPFNLGHSELDIIGHITDNKCVDDKYTLIPDSLSVDLVPDKFHILTSAVIYRAISDQTRKEQIENIIKEIAQGEWFVSMECYFTGFDYAVQGPDSTNKVIARCKESAFLTKHLKAYGGKGEYDGYKVGRLMRNICFSGKGLVEKPANPESIILTDKNSKALSLASDLYNISFLNKSEGEIKMSVDSEKLVEKLEKQLETAKADHDTKVKELEGKLAEAEKSNKSLADEKVKLEESLNTASAELTKIKDKIRLDNRVGALVKAGLEQSEAEAKAKKFDKLDDEMFSEIVALTEAAKKDPTEDGDDDKDIKKGKKKAPYVDKTADAASDDDDDMDADEEDKKKTKKDKQTKKDVEKVKSADMGLKNRKEYDAEKENPNDSNESDVGKTDDVSKVKKALSEEDSEDEYTESSEVDLGLDSDLDEETSKICAHVESYFDGIFDKSNKNKD